MLFWIDEDRKYNISYEEMMRELSEKNSIKKIVYFKDPYKAFIEIISGMIYGVEQTILDGSYSDNEIEKLSINIYDDDYKIEKRIAFYHFEDLIKYITTQKLWRLNIYTSGTTGIPKKVEHNFKTLTRNVKKMDKYKMNIWAFSYDFSHMAGLQVFFQAFLNENMIIYLFESEKKKIPFLINKYKCSNISATPTFYRGLLPFVYETIPYVKNITLGGEKFDSKLIVLLKKVFPDAKIHNIYALTEAGSIFCSKGNKFIIPKQISNLIKVSENNELCLHKSLVGEFSLNDDWYNTQDIVKINENEIEFISRKNDLINIGGYKVNLLEIEAEIQKVDGVIDVVVSGKKNSVMGNILIAKIVKNNKYNEMDLKKEILHCLRISLQAYKIPRIINFIENISKTRSGKKIR